MIKYDTEIMENTVSVCYNFAKKICNEFQRGTSHNEEHMWKVYIRAIDLYYKLNIINDIKLNDKYLHMLAIVTLTHDCADHKYDKSGIIKQKVYDFFKNELNCSSKTINLMLEIIKTASYSNERNLRIKYFNINNFNNNNNKILEDDCKGEILNVKIDWENHFSNFLNENTNTNDINIKNDDKNINDDDEKIREIIIVRHLLSDSDKLEAMGVAGVYRCMKYGLESLILKNELVTAQKIINHAVKHINEKLILLYPHYINTNSGLIIGKKYHEDMKEEILRLEKILTQINTENDPIILQDMLNLINIHM